MTITVSTQQIIIRTASQMDLPGLEWGGEFQHFRLLYQDVYQSTLRNEAVMWIAEHPLKQVIGQLFVQLISTRSELADGSSRAYIYGFRVQPEYHRQGIGTNMLKVAENDLAQRGYRCVSLNVGQDNHEARRLYERCGYVIVAAEPGRWSFLDDNGLKRDVNEPAWRMEKKLDRPVIVRLPLD